MNAGTVAAARSFLFVPADRPERLSKALACGAGAVIVDLEDAVGAGAKNTARSLLIDSLAGLPDRSRVLVRINAARTPWHDDDVAQLAQLAPGTLAAVMLPKAERATDVGRVSDTVAAPVLPLVESAAGLHAVDEIAAARGVARIAFGHLDFQLDAGMHCSPDERELDAVRVALVLASRRAGLPAPVDGVTAALDDDARLAQDTERAMRLGFTGKLCIHPRQVDVVNRGFAPAGAQLEWARRVIDAAQTAGGAFRMDGQMVDEPVLRRARALLATG